MQCEAETRMWKRCSRAARVVVGRCYWGDLASEGTYGRVVRRTWAQFSLVCKQHRDAHISGSPIQLWADVFGPGHVWGAANGIALGWFDTKTGEQRIIPLTRFDLDAIARARDPDETPAEQARRLAYKHRRSLELLARHDE